MLRRLRRDRRVVTVRVWDGRREPGRRCESAALDTQTGHALAPLLSLSARALSLFYALTEQAESVSAS